MAPTNLNGLNLIHPPQQSDEHDLLSGSQFGDLSATEQLDFWARLPFNLEDGPATRKPDDADTESTLQNAQKEAAIQDGHVNVVTGTHIASTDPTHHSQIPFHAFDLQTLLNASIQQQFQPQTATPAPAAPIHPNALIAQLLALQSAQVAFPQQQNPQTVLLNPYTAPTPIASTSSTSSSSTTEPPAKRPRQRKSSISTSNSTTDSPPKDSPAISPPDAALAAAEDKRKRNTAASARFRLKKKEREMALENKAKELEVRVNELEKECESLRRENGWLKGLVVGVTGATQAGAAPTPVAGSSVAVGGVKRGRGDD